MVEYEMKYELAYFVVYCLFIHDYDNIINKYYYPSYTAVH